MSVQMAQWKVSSVHFRYFTPAYGKCAGEAAAGEQEVGEAELVGHSETEPCRAAVRRKPGHKDSIDWKAVQQAHPDQVWSTVLSISPFKDLCKQMLLVQLDLQDSTELALRLQVADAIRCRGMYNFLARRIQVCC